jgi:hypothetical protein
MEHKFYYVNRKTRAGGRSTFEPELPVRLASAGRSILLFISLIASSAVAGWWCGLVVWVMPVGPGWQQASSRPEFNVPDCRFVPG